MNDKPKRGAHLAKYKWPTGRSGNPTGRPANPFSMRQLLRNDANGPLPESFHKRAAQMLGIKPADPRVRRMTYKEFIAKRLLMILGGATKLTAAKEIFELINQLEGKPVQPIENPDGSPINPREQNVLIVTVDENYQEEK
jgi:hypothetical protein